MGNRLSIPQKLHKAVKDNNAHAVQELCVKARNAGLHAHAAALEFKDEKGRTPLLLASARGYHQVARVLIQHGADLGYMRLGGNGGGALHEAAAFGNQAVAQLLLDKGASPFQENHVGKTALEFASAMKHTPLVRLFETRCFFVGHLDLKVAQLVGMSSAWRTRWVALFTRLANPDETRWSSKTEMLLYSGADSPQPRCRLLLDGCHAVVAGQELKLTLRKDHVEPEHASSRRGSDGKYMVSLKCSLAYQEDFERLVASLAQLDTLQVASYNQPTTPTHMQSPGGYFTSTATPGSCEAWQAIAAAHQLQEANQDAGEPQATTFPHSNSTASLSQLKATPRSAWDADPPDSVPQSDSWNVMGPLHAYRPSRSSQPPSPSSGYYVTRPTDPTSAPHCSQPQSPTGGYYVPTQPSRRQSEAGNRPSILVPGYSSLPPSIPIAPVPITPPGAYTGDLEPESGPMSIPEHFASTSSQPPSPNHSYFDPHAQPISNFPATSSSGKAHAPPAAPSFQRTSSTRPTSPTPAYHPAYPPATSSRPPSPNASYFTPHHHMGTDSPSSAASSRTASPNSHYYSDHRSDQNPYPAHPAGLSSSPNSAYYHRPGSSRRQSSAANTTPVAPFASQPPSPNAGYFNPHQPLVDLDRLAGGLSQPNSPNAGYYDRRNDPVARPISTSTSQPPSPSAGYYHAPSSRRTAEPTTTSSTARQHSSASTRRQAPQPTPSSPAGYHGHSQSMPEVTAAQAPAPADGYWQHSRTVPEIESSRATMASQPATPSAAYYQPNPTGDMAALPGETDEEFAVRLATSLGPRAAFQEPDSPSSTSVSPSFAERTNQQPLLDSLFDTPIFTQTTITTTPSTTPHASSTPGGTPTELPATTPFSSSRPSSTGMPSSTLRAASFQYPLPNPFEDLNTCVICMSRPREVGFLHGETVHNCACRDCAKMIPVGTACPICRQAIERVLGVY